MIKLKNLLYASLCSTLFNLSAHSVNHNMLEYAADNLSHMILDNDPITPRYIESKLGFVDEINDSWDYTPNLQKTFKTKDYATLLSQQNLKQIKQFQEACQATIDSFEGSFSVMQNGIQLLHNSVIKKLDDYALFKKHGRDICEDYNKRQLKLIHKRKADEDLLHRTNKKLNVDQLSDTSDRMRTEYVH